MGIRAATRGLGAVASRRQLDSLSHAARKKPAFLISPVVLPMAVAGGMAYFGYARWKSAVRHRFDRGPCGIRACRCRRTPDRRDAIDDHDSCFQGGPVPRLRG